MIGGSTNENLWDVVDRREYKWKSERKEKPPHDSFDNIQQRKLSIILSEMTINYDNDQTDQE